MTDTTPAAVEALKELVALKELKDRFQWNGEWTSNRNRNEYERRQPLAWEAARAALAHQPPAAVQAKREPQWISIKDRQPKIYEHVVVLTDNSDGDPWPTTAHWNGTNHGFLGLGGKRVKPATHWFSIPAPPIGAAGEGAEQ